MSADCEQSSTRLECAPLRTLEELLNFRSRCCFCKSSPIAKVHDPLPKRPRVLLCHDFKGGYHLDKYHIEDRSELVELPEYSASLDYRFDYWNKIDIFVYFAHHLVTIPPCSWIKQAHSKGVKILGTFIVEWNSKIIDEIISPENLPRVITNLVKLCVEANFDGYLFNMEVEVKKEQVNAVIKLLHEVRNRLASVRPGSLVIWYDSLTTRGKLTYYNELVDENKPFFDVCDGIFLNYGWTESHIRRSVALAGHRANDIYVGIDVFGRKTPYEAGFNSPKVANEVGNTSQCSVALFAPGWVLETNDAKDFEKNQERFWKQMANLDIDR